MSVICQGYRYC